MDSGEIVQHWIEISARTQEGEPTLVHLRSLMGLEHNTQYAVAFRGLMNSDGIQVEPFISFKALRDGLLTDSNQIEESRPGYESMFSALSEAGFERSSLQSAWWYGEGNVGQSKSDCRLPTRV